MKKVFIPTLLIATLAVSGCDSVCKQDIGAATGGILGGLLGNQVGHGSARTAAVIGGTLLGACIGGSIGHTMDEVDRMNMNQALESTPTNQTRCWTNPDSHICYKVTPKRTYYHGDQPCREYTTSAIIGGKRQQVYGTACRQADGAWKIVS